MAARNQTLAMVALAGLIGLGITLGWLYTRPVMTAEERADVESRAERLRVPSAPYASASRASSIQCAAYLARRPVGGGIWEEPPPPDLELERMRELCLAGFDAALENPLPASDADPVALVEAGEALTEDARFGPQASRLRVELLRIWSADSLVRAGLGDRESTRIREDAWRTAAPEGPLSDADARDARRMLARIRDHHVDRLHRVEILALQLFDESAREEPDEALAGVCRAEVVDVAEALAGIGCHTMTARVCFERVNEVIDAHDHGRRPEWTPLLPPRARREWDARCQPLTAPLREVVRRAVLAEMELALFDEIIAHAVAGGSVEAAVARPIPTFEGEPLRRRRRDPGVVFEAPDWLGRRGEVVIALAERHEPPPAPPPLLGTY
ncbi:MAG: hypothetical protein J0L92_22485 [Deltaproteobacteria bacterium]|nr:hypothetical protein [Deltaproteobacteria bacterium]